MGTLDPAIYSGHRHDAEFICEHLDRNDLLLGSLTRASGVKVSLSATTTLKMSGSFTYTSAASSLGPAEEIDWLNDRVRIRYRCRNRRGAVIDIPLGVYLLSAPSEDIREEGSTWNVEMISKLQVLDEDTVSTTYQVLSGTSAVAAVTALIRSAGETRIAATDNGSTLGSDMSWDVGTSKLSIVNDILTAVNYWSIWCDGEGSFRVEPYAEPGQRAPLWDYVPGENCINLAAMTRDKNMASVPNRAVMIGASNGDEDPLIGVYTNDDPMDPYSTVSRGRVITISQENVEADTQGTINALAKRKLLDNVSPVATDVVKALPLPLWFNDAVTWARPSSEGDTVAPRLCTVRYIDFTEKSTNLCTVTLVEV